MREIYRQLADAGILFFEYGVTALDAYYDEKPRPVRFVVAECSVIDLARCFSELQYPNLPYADAALDTCEASLALRTSFAESGGAPAGAIQESSMQESSVRFLCTEDALHCEVGGSWANFRRNPQSDIFYDQGNIYDDLKAKAIPSCNTDTDNALFESAALATFHPEGYRLAKEPIPLPACTSSYFQKDLLITVLTGPYPAAGLELLKKSGFIAREWPEIALLDDVDHAKDYHPEGNGWNHTLQTFSYRKERDLVLSLALLLHDIGKPESLSREGKRFDQHAELGARRARKFLARLGFSTTTQEDVAFLIRYHMMPAALSVLPIQKTEPVITDPRFPALLELFRCDEFSSYKDPEGYYEACNAYQTIRRNMKNPYRNADGSLKSRSMRTIAHY